MEKIKELANRSLSNYCALRFACKLSITTVNVFNLYPGMRLSIFSNPPGNYADWRVHDLAEQRLLLNVGASMRVSTISQTGCQETRAEQSIVIPVYRAHG